MTVCPSFSVNAVSWSTIACIFAAVSLSLRKSFSYTILLHVAAARITSTHLCSCGLAPSACIPSCFRKISSQLSSCLAIGIQKFSNRILRSNRSIRVASFCRRILLNSAGCGFPRRKNGMPFAEAKTGTRRRPDTLAYGRTSNTFLVGGEHSSSSFDGPHGGRGRG